GDAVVGRRELVFEVEDASRGLHRDPLVDQYADARGHLQLTPGVAAVAAVGAVWPQDPGRVEAAQECGLDTEELGRLAHGDGRVVAVVELSDSIAHEHHPRSTRGARAPPGPPAGIRR